MSTPYSGSNATITGTLFWAATVEDQAGRWHGWTDVK